MSLSLRGFCAGNVMPVFFFWLVTPFGGNPIMGILFLALAAWASLVYMGRLEQEYGTIRFLSWWFPSSTNISIAYLLVDAVLVVLIPIFGHGRCAGMWPLLLLTMTLQSLKQPEGSTQSFWGLVQIPTRWYPLALIGFFSLISMSLQVEMLAAWLIGVGAHQAEGGQPLHQKIAFLRMPLARALPSLNAVSSFEAAALAGSGRSLSSGGDGAKQAMQTIQNLPIILARSLVRVCPASVRSSYVGSGSIGGSKIGNGLAAVESTVGRAETSMASSFKAFSGTGNRLGEESA